MQEVKHFPADMSVFEVDREDMKKCLVSGLFEETAKVDGKERIFYTYLAPGSVSNSPCLVVAPPDVADVPAWLEDGFWFSFAGEHGLFLHVLVPGEKGWNEDGSDADYMNKVYSAIQSRRGYVTIQDNIYAMGIGGGAVIAQQAVMKMSSEWAGLATFGEMSDAALLNAEVLAGSENTGKTELSINAAKVQVPVWMAWGRNTGMNAAVCAYWKKQNDVDNECFSSFYADEIWFPSVVSKASQVNEEKIAQVRVTNTWGTELDKPLADEVWEFLNKACRHRGYGHKMLRNRIDPEAYGFELKTMEHQGFTRRWYEYVPENVKKSGAAVPLVVCMHGRGGSAETFLSLSGMSRVAEERNFIALFPESGAYQIRPGALRNLLLWNGEYKGERFDDVGFVLRMIEDVKARYAVDATRVYACGQSSGGMMTTALAEAAPQVFAAVSPWSALVNPDQESVLPEKMDPAVPFMFLFGDRDWLCADPENGEMPFKVTKMIADYLKNLIRVYELDEEPATYVCGEITWFVYRNKDRVPMLTVGRVAGMTHANYPRESWIAYDEFLARFSKSEDGELFYMGERV